MPAWRWWLLAALALLAVALLSASCAPLRMPESGVQCLEVRQLWGLHVVRVCRAARAAGRGLVTEELVCVDGRP